MSHVIYSERKGKYEGGKGAEDLNKSIAKRKALEKVKKYKTLLGTPTDKKPSKERQYHIDAYRERHPDYHND